MSTMKLFSGCCGIVLFACTVIVLAPASTLAGPRWCYTDQPDAIFCDDADRYCIGSALPADPNEACPAAGDGCYKSNGAARAVWVSLPDGCQVNIDECCNPDMYTCANGGQEGCGCSDEEYAGLVTSIPFGLGLPNSGKLGWQTVNLTSHINNRFGGPSDAVVGTDANPLILDFIMNGQTAGKLTHANTYFELALHDLMTGVDDRAPTDFIFSPYCETECAPNPGSTYDPGFPMICQQDVPPAGCPPIESAPHHAVIAVGALAFLDKDPCHCDDPGLISSTNEHLAVFDGHKWWTLPGPFPGEGDFMLRNLNHIVRLTVTSTMLKVEMTALVPEPDEYSWCEIPRDYQGPFNKLHLGFGLSCLIDLGSWECANSGGRRRYTYTKAPPGAGRPVFDNIALYGGEGHTLPSPPGACCLPNGECAEAVIEYECEVELEGVFNGPNTLCADQICCPVPFADADADGDVDQQDFGAFQCCYTGPGPATVVGKCTCFDRDYWGYGDEDVDADDFTAFEACWSGPTVPVDPACGG